VSVKTINCAAHTQTEAQTAVLIAANDIREAAQPGAAIEDSQAPHALFIRRRVACAKLVSQSELFALNLLL
jgi:hypothetical protein